MRTDQRLQVLPVGDEYVYFLKISIYAVNPIRTEAVLAMLIAKFKFAPSDKKVFWQMNVISTPSVDKASKTPVMPLVVSKVEA